MNISCNLRFCLAAVTMLLFASCVRADVVIDNFADSQSVSQNVAGPAALSNGPIATPGAIGGMRSIGLSGSVFPGQSVSFSVGAGTADAQTGSLSTAVSTLLYNAGGAGLGNLLAGTNAVKLVLEQFNIGSQPSKIDVTINDGSTTNTQSVVLSNSIGTTTDLLFNFSGSGLNFNNINSILVTLNSNGGAGADITLSNITAQTIAVPEAATFAIWTVLGGVGLTLTRRFGLIRR